MMNLEIILEKLAEFQGKHSMSIVIVAVIVTLLIGTGMSNIRMETDINKELPQDMPVIKLQDRVRDTFSGSDIVLVVAQLDYGATQKNAVRDIRDPRVMRMLLELEDQVKDESSVDQVQSIASVFGKMDIPKTTEGVKSILAKIPDSQMAFNKDYSATLLYTYANIGSDNERIKELDATIQEDIDASSVPPGVKVRITGMPSIRSTLMDLLQKDAIFTISLAGLIILIMLILLNSPRARGVIVFTPLALGLIWTMGTMGLLDIPLSIATVGVGAMILGLGVEYSVFYVKRYEEEQNKGVNQVESLKTAMCEVGSAIIGSSTTTIVGFLALLLASMPMMHHLGFTLALGIFYCVIAALVVNPALMVVEERITHVFDVRKHEKLSERIEKHTKGINNDKD